MLHGIHIKDTKMLNSGGERHPPGEKKEKNLRTICFWDVKIKFLSSEIEFFIH